MLIAPILNEQFGLLIAEVFEDIVFNELEDLSTGGGLIAVLELQIAIQLALLVHLDNIFKLLHHDKLNLVVSLFEFGFHLLQNEVELWRNLRQEVYHLLA